MVGDEGREFGLLGRPPVTGHGPLRGGEEVWWWRSVQKLTLQVRLCDIEEGQRFCCPESPILR